MISMWAAPFPRQIALASPRKLSKHDTRSEPPRLLQVSPSLEVKLGGTAVNPAFQIPGWVSALTPPSDGLWFGSVKWNVSILDQVSFDQCFVRAAESKVEQSNQERPLALTFHVHAQAHAHEPEHVDVYEVASQGNFKP